MFRSKPLKSLRLIGAASLLLGASAGIAVAAMSAEETIKARQDNLKDLGAAFKGVRDELRKPQPAMLQLKASSDQIAKLANEMHAWFPRGTGPESKVETDAKAEIWDDPQGFESALKKLQAEAPKLQQLAQAEDVNGIKAQVGKLGAACKGCHDTYRVPQD